MMFFIILCVCVIIVLLFHIINTKPVNQAKSQPESPNEVALPVNNNIVQVLASTAMRIPDIEERRRMSPSDRIKLLEKLGVVPDNPDRSDYFLAEKTSWWGKRLDPQEFWKDKVLWNDKVANFEARRRGRGYPPIPYDDPAFAHLSDVDKKADGFHIEGSSPSYVSSEREMFFWGHFSKTHPPSPESIQRWLGNEADSWLRIKKKIENDPNYTKRFGITLEGTLARTLNTTNSSMFPPESVSPDAYLWDHVIRKRTEYGKIINSEKEEDSLWMRLFFNDVYVDHALITEPLTQEQVDAANAWKVKYLNRLRSEQWDESYINAYLQAWDLTEEYVFGEKEVIHFDEKTTKEDSL